MRLCSLTVFPVSIFRRAELRAIRKVKESLTIHREHRRLADPPRGDVLGDARVVALMPQFGLAEQQVPVGGLHKAGRGHVVRVGLGDAGSYADGRRRLQGRAVPQPVQLGRRYTQWWRASQLSVAADFHRQRIGRRQEMLLQIWDAADTR